MTEWPLATLATVSLVTLAISATNLPSAAASLPAQGGDAPTILALGDSYAAGEGLPANWPKDDNRDCNRSTVAWPSLARRVATNVNADLGGSIRWNGDAERILARRGSKASAQPLTYRACSGATFGTKAFDGSTHDHAAQQLATQVDDGGNYEIVTLSMGGNDLGFAPIILGCVLDYGLKAVSGSGGAPNLALAIAKGLVTAETSASCNQDWGQVQQQSNRILNGMDVGFRGARSRMSLSEVYEWILRNKVKSGGTLVITTYPNLFADPDTWPAFHLGRCGAVSARDARGIRESTSIANSRIQSAAREADGRFGEASIEVVNQESLLEGHELCGPKGEWLYGVRSILTNMVNSCSGTGAYTDFRPTRAFHPTCDAHQVTGATVGVLLADVLRSANTPPPRQTTSSAPSGNSGGSGSTPVAGNEVAAYCRALETRQSEIIGRYNEGRTRTQQAEDLAEIFNAGADQLGTFLDDLDRYLEVAADMAPPEIEDITEVLSNEIEAGDGSLLAAADFALDYLLLAEQISIVDGYTRDNCGFGF